MRIVKPYFSSPFCLLLFQTRPTLGLNVHNRADENNNLRPQQQANNNVQEEDSRLGTSSRQSKDGANNQQEEFAGIVKVSVEAIRMRMLLRERSTMIQNAINRWHGPASYSGSVATDSGRLANHGAFCGGVGA